MCYDGLCDLHFHGPLLESLSCLPECRTGYPGSRESAGSPFVDSVSCSSFGSPCWLSDPLATKEVSTPYQSCILHVALCVDNFPWLQSSSKSYWYI